MSRRSFWVHCYFPVSLPAKTPDKGRRDDFDVFQSTFQDLGVSEQEVGEPEDYRMLNQFLLKEGWIKHVSGYSVSELFQLTTPPQEDEILLSSSLMHLPFHALQTMVIRTAAEVRAVFCAMRMTLPLNQKSERARQVEDWNGVMGLVTEEEWASS